MTSVEVENSHSFTEKEQPEAKKQKKPFKVMPFGKYRLMSLVDIARITELKNGKIINTGKNYLQFIYDLEYVKEDLKDAIKPYLN